MPRKTLPPRLRVTNRQATSVHARVRAFAQVHPPVGHREHPETLHSSGSVAGWWAGRRQRRHAAGWVSRSIEFTERGFALNGRVVKLRGLDRHQTFPFVGQAMPARVQRRDAQILRQRSSNATSCARRIIPSRATSSGTPATNSVFWFLRRSPGLAAYRRQRLAGPCRRQWVKRMIRRDWNHPAIVCCGACASTNPHDDHDFYARTNALAHTRSIRHDRRAVSATFRNPEPLEDVFTVNDFGWPLRPPNHPRYLNTEFAAATPIRSGPRTDDGGGATAGTSADPACPHARSACVRSAIRPAASAGAHSTTTPILISAPATASTITAWPIFFANRNRPQVSTNRNAILPRRLSWSLPFTGRRETEAIGFRIAMICSNADHLKLYTKQEWRLDADRRSRSRPCAQFTHLKYAPFTVNSPNSYTLAAGGAICAWTAILPASLQCRRPIPARVWTGSSRCNRTTPSFTPMVRTQRARRSTRDRRVRHHSPARERDPIVLTLEGPADIIGDNPFALVGGTSARSGFSAHASRPAWFASPPRIKGSEASPSALCCGKPKQSAHRPRSWKSGAASAQTGHGSASLL